MNVIMRSRTSFPTRKALALRTVETSEPTIAGIDKLVVVLDVLSFRHVAFRRRRRTHVGQAVAAAAAAARGNDLAPHQLYNLLVGGDIYRRFTLAVL